MSVTKMSDKKCKYYNSGCCKFKEHCKYAHPKVACTVDNCRDNKCPKRHPKNCRYKDLCRRRATCLYKHGSVTNDISMGKVQNKALLIDIKELKEKLAESN